MGTYLLFNFFWAVYLFFKKKNFYLKITFAAIALLLLITVYIAGARAATFSIVGGLVLLGFLYLGFVPKKRQLRILGRILLILSVVVFLVTVLFIFQEGSFVRETFIEKATNSRLVVWEKAWKGFKERPLLGWGPENYEFAFMKYFNPCMFMSECGSEIWFDRAHNIIFDSLVTSGILGFLAYLALFVATFFALWKNYLKKRISFWAFAIPFITLIAYLVQNLTVFDMVSSYLMFFIVLSFIISATRKEESLPSSSGEELKAGKQQWALGLLLVIFCFSFFQFIIQPLRASKFVIEALKAGTIEERLEFYDKAFNTSPLGKFQIREFLANNTQNTMQEVLDRNEDLEKLNLEGIVQELEAAIGAVKDNLVESPLDFRSALRIAHLYNVYFFFDRSKSVQAEEAAQQAVVLSPTNQQGYWALAQAQLYQQKFAGALISAQKAIELEPRWFQSHLVALQIARATKNTEKAREIIARAVEIDPSWQAELEAMIDWD